MVDYKDQKAVIISNIDHKSRLMDFTKTKITLNRPITSYNKVQKFIAEIIRGKKIFLNKNRLNNKKYLEIGVGPSVGEEFIGLDYIWNPTIDVCWDVTKGLPLRDNSLRGVYSEHCLEHLPFNSIEFVLSEIHRVLEPDGVVRIVVPDGELYLKSYSKICDGDLLIKIPYEEEEKEYYKENYRPIISINRIFRSYGHQFIYDYELMKRLLENAGFKNINRENYRTGREDKLLKDLEWRKVESLYIEASK